MERSKNMRSRHGGNPLFPHELISEVWSERAIIRQKGSRDQGVSRQVDDLLIVLGNAIFPPRLFSG